jgi:hypothetical protein
MQGFEAGTEDLPAVPAELDQDTRDRATRVLAAMLCGETPEQISRSLTDGEWPTIVTDMLDRAGEPEELTAHLVLLVGVLHGAEVPAT